MAIDARRYLAIHQYALLAAAVYYLLSLFVLKSLSTGVVIIFSVALYNLFHRQYYTGRLKQAAANWVVPVLIALLTSGRLLDPPQLPLRLIDLGFICFLCAAAGLLLYTGKAQTQPSRRKTILIVKIRIAVQVTLFTLYLIFSAYTWVRGSQVELIFWVLVNLLTVSLLPFLVGRALCGWICPNATLQDALYRTLEFKRPIPGFPAAIEAQSRSSAMNIAGAIDKNAPYLPFTLLLAWFPMFLAETVFNLTELAWYPTAFMYGLFLLSLLMPWRKMCTYFCWLSSYRCLAGQNSLLRLWVNQENCKQCKVCLAEQECPFHIDIRNRDGELPATCCLCFACKNACPHKDVFRFGMQAKSSSKPGN